MIIITLDIMVMVQRVTVKKTTKKKIGNRELHMDNGRKALKQQRRRRKSLLHCVTHSGVHFMVFVLFDVYSSSLCGMMMGVGGGSRWGCAEGGHTRDNSDAEGGRTDSSSLCGQYVPIERSANESNR